MSDAAAHLDEVLLLSAIVVDPDALAHVAHALDRRHFLDPRRAEIWAAAVRIHEAGRDISSLPHELPRLAGYVAFLAGSSPDGAGDRALLASLVLEIRRGAVERDRRAIGKRRPVTAARARVRCAS